MPRPPVYDDGLRADLVRHAAAALAAGGVEHLSLRGVATAAGTSTNAVYTLFGGKDELVRAAVTTAMQSFTAAQLAVGRTDDPEADLTGLGHAYRRWAVEHPELYAVMFGGRVPLPPTRTADCEEDAQTPLVDAVVRLVDAGVYGGAPTGQIVDAIWAAVHGVVSLEIAVWSDRDPADREALYDAQLAAIRRAWRVTA